MSLKKELRLMVGTSRINPIRYFSYLGVAYIIMLLVMLVIGIILDKYYADTPGKAITIATYVFVNLMQPLYMVVNLWWLARRLHDFNVTGWWVMVPLVSMFLLMGIIIFDIHTPQMLNLALFFLGAGSLVILTILGLFPGRPGRDDYGPPPPKNTIYNYIFFILFVGLFFGYLIWRLMALMPVRVS